MSGTWNQSLKLDTYTYLLYITFSWIKIQYEWNNIDYLSIFLSSLWKLLCFKTNTPFPEISSIDIIFGVIHKIKSNIHPNIINIFILLVKIIFVLPQKTSWTYTYILTSGWLDLTFRHKKLTMCEQFGTKSLLLSS